MITIIWGTIPSIQVFHFKILDLVPSLIYNYTFNHYAFHKLKKWHPVMFFFYKGNKWAYNWAAMYQRLYIWKFHGI